MFGFLLSSIFANGSSLNQQKLSAALQDSARSGFGMVVVPGSGNHGSTLPWLRQKLRLNVAENQPAMVKDAWTGWDEFKKINQKALTA